MTNCRPWTTNSGCPRMDVTRKPWHGRSCPFNPWTCRAASWCRVGPHGPMRSVPGMKLKKGRWRGSSWLVPKHRVTSGYASSDNLEMCISFAYNINDRDHICRDHCDRDNNDRDRKDGNHNPFQQPIFTMSYMCDNRVYKHSDWLRGLEQFHRVMQRYTV